MTGCRVCEALAMRACDVDLEAAEVLIATLKRRSNHWRVVPVGAGCGASRHATGPILRRPGPAALREVTIVAGTDLAPYRLRSARSRSHDRRAHRPIVEPTMARQTGRARGIVQPRPDKSVHDHGPLACSNTPTADRTEHGNAPGRRPYRLTKRTNRAEPHQRGRATRPCHRRSPRPPGHARLPDPGRTRTDTAGSRTGRHDRA